MTERTEVLCPENNADDKVVIRECRACLKMMEDKTSVCNIFQSWAPPWTGMGASIAEDLSKLAYVEISDTDNHPNIICEPCYQHLLDAAMFAARVRVSDSLLRQRHISELNNTDKIWPKPIQVDKNLNGDVLPEFGVEIKQEIIDEEYEHNAPDDAFREDDNSYGDVGMENLDIKTEPEDFVEPPPLTITINDTISLNPITLQNRTILNGTGEYDAIITDSVQSTPIFNGSITEQCLNATIKEEPQSDDDEQVPDLPLECMLCMKSFNSISGLKAHVIAHHSYKSVKRKLGSGDSPQKKQKDDYRCEICRRRFVTSTDLMVHETCHNKHSCYGCSRKFDSFKQLSNHRRRCTASLTLPVNKPKTLDDVIRPMKDEKINADSSQEDSNDSQMKLLLEIHSNNKNQLNWKTELSSTADLPYTIKEETT